MEILNHKLEDIYNLKGSTILDIRCYHCQSIFKRKVFYVKYSINKGCKNLYCSKKCMFDYYSSKMNTEITCHRCGCKTNKPNSNIKPNNKTFCSNTCYVLSHAPKKVVVKKPKGQKISLERFYLKCKQCDKDIERTPVQLRKIKNGQVFCSKSCRMTHKNLNNPKKYSCRRSKAESFLSELIKLDFPDLILLENDRTVLLSKLEIDIYLPTIKLAIELNGPVHYFPIYGEETLRKCQDKDIRKQIEIQSLSINLLVVDISRITSKKKSEDFLIEYYSKYIKPIISSHQEIKNFADDALHVPFGI